MAWNLPKLWPKKTTVWVGCETEFVECGECSFVAVQVTLDGKPTGTMSIVPCEDVD